MKKEILKNPESAAQEALGQGHFDLFFTHLSAIEEDGQSTRLITDAIKIALGQKNVEVLSQLTQYSSTNTHRSEIMFCDLLTALIELEVVEKAIQTIILYADDTLEPKIRWSALMRILLRRENFTYLRQVYPHVKHGLIDKAFLQEIMHRCLHAGSVHQRPLDWLFWLGEYRYFYQHEGFVNAQLDEIADAILTTENFKYCCQQIIRIPDRALVDPLLMKLFERCVVKKKTQSLAELTALLPSSLRWLLETQRPFTQTAQFNVLEKLEYAYRLAFLERQLPQYLDSQKSAEDKTLQADILAIAEAVKGYQQPAIECACHLLIERGRMTPVFALLPRLSHAAAQRAVIDKLLRHALSEADYQRLLPYVPHLEFCKYKAEDQAWLKAIPPTLVVAEAKQRRQRIAEEAETQWSAVTEIEDHAPEYPALLQTFHHLVKCGLTAAAVEICRKMKAADSRNAPVKILLNAVLRWDQETLSPSDWRLAAEAAGLFYPSEKAKACREQIEILAKTYPSGDYQHAFSALMTLHLSMGDFFSDLAGLTRCADALLEAKDSAAAGALFVVKQGLFSVVKRTPSAHLLRKIAEKAAVKVIEAHTDEALKSWLQEMKITVIIDFAECLTDLLLTRSRLPVALHLLNAVTGEKIAGTVQRAIADYLKTVSPSQKYIEILKQVTSPQRQSDLMESFLSTVRRLPIDYAHLVLLAAIPQGRLRQQGLMDYMLSAILDAKFDLARQAAADLPDTQKVLWLKIIQWIQERKFELVLDELLKHPQDFHHQQLLTWLSHHYRELQPSSDADQLSKRLSQHHRLYLELHEDAKTIESGQATALRDIHRSLCLAFFEQWAELIQKQANYSLLLDTCQKLFIPHAQAFNPYFSWPTYLGDLALDWIAHRQYSHVEAIAKLLLAQNSTYTTEWLGRLLPKLLAQSAWTCIESIKQCLPAGYVDKWRILIGEHHFHHYQDEKAIQELMRVKNKNWFHYQEVVIDRMQVLICQRQITLAQKLGEQLLADAPHCIYQPIVETLVKQGYLNRANHYIAKMSAWPDLQSQLRQQVQQAYQLKLEQWLGKEKAHYLLDTFHKITQCLKLSRQRGQEKSANSLKNELIVECRSQLDKVFLAFCQQRYGQAALGKNGKIPYRYFPVVPELKKGETVEISLRGYLRRVSRAGFPQDNPELYQYLLAIQPLHNPEYQWLSDLYALANQQKHSEDLPWQPQIESRTIHIMDYLPCLLNGLCEIFLKVVQPKFPLQALKQWRFSDYFPLEKSTVVEEIKEREQKSVEVRGFQEAREQKRLPDFAFRQSGRESPPGMDRVGVFSLFSLPGDDKNSIGGVAVKKPPTLPAVYGFR